MQVARFDTAFHRTQPELAQRFAIPQELLRTLLASDAPSANLAVDLFVESIVRETGALTAVLGGLDALVFTGGIDESANLRGGPRITHAASAVSGWVLAADEEGAIARHTARLLGR